MIYPYPGNSPSLIADFHREQSGNHYLILFYKNCSRYCTKAQEIKAALGAAKFTQSSKDLVSWFEELWASTTKKKLVKAELIPALLVKHLLKMILTIKPRWLCDQCPGDDILKAPVY